MTYHVGRLMRKVLKYFSYPALSLFFILNQAPLMGQHWRPDIGSNPGEVTQFKVVQLTMWFLF